MEAIVLAGGLGTRLRSEVPDLPKAMAPVAGRPFLALLLRHLAKQGVSKAILSLGYKAEAITEYFGSSFEGLALEHVIESSPLGTGGAVRLAMARMSGSHVYVFNGDTYLDLDLAAVEADWQRHQEPIIIARPVEDAGRYGRLLASGDRLVGFTEKGIAGPGVINAGVYVLQSGQLNGFEPNTAFSFEEEVLAPAAKNQSMRVLVCDGKFIDIGIPEDYRRAQVELAGL